MLNAAKQRRAILTIAVGLVLTTNYVVQARRTDPGSLLTHPYEDESIDPFAEVSANGRHVALSMGGPAASHPVGTTVRVTVTVYQPDTDAFAIGLGKGVSVPEDGPETGTFVRIAHAQGEENFEEGPAIASYHVEIKYRGRIVRTWTRSADVLLLYAE